MSLLEQNLPIDEIIVMVQKEAAERLTAEIGSRESEAVTVAVNYYAEAEMLLKLRKPASAPPQGRQRAVIGLKNKKKPAVKITNEQHFFKIVKAAFFSKKKNSYKLPSNGLGIPKAEISKALNTIGKTKNQGQKTLLWRNSPGFPGKLL